MNLEKILQNDKRIWDEEILDYPQLFELARTYDKELLETLFNNKDSKESFSYKLEIAMSLNTTSLDFI